MDNGAQEMGALPEMYCTKCGRNNPDKNKFCNGCGVKFVIITESKFVLSEPELPPPPPPPPVSQWTVPLEPEPAVEGGAGTIVLDSPDAPEVEYGADLHGETKSVPNTDLTELDIGQAVSSATVESGNDAEMDHARDAVLTDPDPSITASGEGPVAELEDSEKITVNFAELSNAASVPQVTNDTEIPENALETVPDRAILPEKAAILTDATPTDLAERDESSIDLSFDTIPAPALVDDSEIIIQKEAHDPSTLDEPPVPEPPIFDTRIENEKEVASDKESILPHRPRSLTERPVERPKEDLGAALASSDSDSADLLDSKVKGTWKSKESCGTTVPGRRGKVSQTTSDINNTDDAQVPIAPSDLDKNKDVSFDPQGEQQLASIKPHRLVTEIDNVPCDKNSFQSGASKQDLTAVFEDAELRLDEILVDSRVPAERPEAELVIRDELAFASDDSLEKDRGFPSIADELKSVDRVSQHFAESTDRQNESFPNSTIETSASLPEDAPTLNLDSEESVDSRRTISEDIGHTDPMKCPQPSPGSKVETKEFLPGQERLELPVDQIFAQPPTNRVKRKRSALKFPFIIVGIMLTSIIGGLVYYFIDDGPNGGGGDTTPTPRPVYEGMAYIQGGEFLMGSDNDQNSKPPHRVSVSPFYMDITEVTNQEYKKFVDSTGYKPPSDWSNGTFPQGKAKFPVVNVNWDDAVAYAKWAGKRLPTEEEWEFAARGTDGRLYPWGNDWKAEYANAGNEEGKGGIREVGQGDDKSPFGMLDMVGNAWEWTSSDFVPYPGGKLSEKTSSKKKIIRGGCFVSPPEKATVTFRIGYPRAPDDTYINTSFRCAMDLPGAVK